MIREDILTNARFAGQVARYHTWPVVRQQSVGEHTWQVLRIYYQVFGSLLTSVVTYILWHDAGELVVGDLPFPVKQRIPGLKELMDNGEAQAVLSMGGELPVLTEGEHLRVKICDLLDMYEFGLSEVAMGNEFGRPIVNDVYAAILRLEGRLLPGEQHKVAHYMKWIERVMSRPRSLGAA